MSIQFMLEAWAGKNTEVAMSFLLTGQSERTRTAILNCLQEGCESGEDYRKLASRIEAIVICDREKALGIARNVVGAVLSESRFLSHLASGVTHKEWVCPARPIREIAGHRQAERKYAKRPCPISEPFLVNGVRLRFPGDYMAGHPEECIGCLCMALGVRK